MKPFVDYDPLFPMAQPLEVIAPLVHEALSRLRTTEPDLVITRVSDSEVPGQVAWGVASHTLGPRLGGVFVRAAAAGCELAFIAPDRLPVTIGSGTQDVTVEVRRKIRQAAVDLHNRRVAMLTAMVSDVVEFLAAQVMVEPPTPQPVIIPPPGQPRRLRGPNDENREGLRRLWELRDECIKSGRPIPDFTIACDRAKVTWYVANRWTPPSIREDWKDRKHYKFSEFSEPWYELRSDDV